MAVETVLEEVITAMEEVRFGVSLAHRSVSDHKRSSVLEFELHANC
jgi:hypothetical protein